MKWISFLLVEKLQHTDMPSEKGSWLRTLRGRGKVLSWGSFLKNKTRRYIIRLSYWEMKAGQWRSGSLLRKHFAGVLSGSFRMPMIWILEIRLCVCMRMCMESGLWAIWLVLDSWLHGLLVVWPWASYLISVSGFSLLWELVEPLCRPQRVSVVMRWSLLSALEWCLVTLRVL